MPKKDSKRPTKHWIILGAVVLLLLIIGLWIGGTYNRLVGLDESVKNAWGKVQSAYQRRADLVPNLVATVRAYSDYEGEVLTQITEARASVGRAATPAELAAAGQQLDSALARLLVVVEQYPNLKANENYLALQDQLEGTENRIKVERDNYNEAVRALNVKVRRFPSNAVAGWFGFGPKDFFEAQPGAEAAPDVKGLFEK